MATTKSKFGPQQLTNQTPSWANNAMMLALTLCKAVIAYIAATTLVPENYKYEVTLLITILIEPILMFVAKMWGVPTTFPVDRNAPDPLTAMDSDNTNSETKPTKDE